MHVGKNRAGKLLNLTEGPILPVLTRLALPIMASSFLSTAYNLTDMVWIGMLGAKAVAGIGVGGMYVWLSQGLSALCRMGGQVNAGQCLGRGDRASAGQYALASMQLVTLLGVIYSCLCLLFPDMLLSVFELEDPVTAQHAKIYMMITCGGILFSYLNTTLTGLYTAQGDSRTPLVANMAGLVLNMVLDPVLILGAGIFPRLEVVGAAVATVFAQTVVLLVMLFAMKKDNLLRQTPLFQLPAWCYFGKIFKLGIPTAVQSTLYCAISMVLTRIISPFGEGAIAVQRVGGQIESLTWNTADGFGAAMNAFAAQNYGAGKPGRIRKGYHMSAITMALWGAVIGIAFILVPEPISTMFFHEPEMIPQSVAYFMILSISEPFLCVELLTVGAMSGLGRTKECSLISVLLTGLRIPIAGCLTQTGLGVEGVWWALTLTSVAKGIILHFAFYRQVNKVKEDCTIQV